jgi:hypothetical protein
MSIVTENIRIPHNRTRHHRLRDFACVWRDSIGQSFLATLIHMEPTEQGRGASPFAGSARWLMSNPAPELVNPTKKR